MPTSHASKTLKGRVEEFHKKYDDLIDAAISGVPNSIKKRPDAGWNNKNEEIHLFNILFEIKSAISLNPSKVEIYYEYVGDDAISIKTPAYRNPEEAIKFAETHLVPILRKSIETISKDGKQYEALKAKEKKIVGSYTIIATLFDEWKEGAYLQALYNDLHTAKKAKAEKASASGEKSFEDMIAASRQANSLGTGRR